MEKKLKTLFDYQRFKGNSKLAKMIAESEGRYLEELSDEKLTVVYGAGDLFAGHTEENEDDYS